MLLAAELPAQFPRTPNPYPVPPTVPGTDPYPGPTGRQPRHPSDPRRDPGTNAPLPPNRRPDVIRDDEPAVSLDGRVRIFDERRLILETTDHRFLRIAVAPDTQISKQGAEAKAGAFAEGDTVNVEARRDRSGWYRAERVSWQASATAGERAELQRLPEAVGERAAPQVAAQSGTRGAQAEDPDKPTFRRKRGAEPEPQAPPKAEKQTPAPAEPQEEPPPPSGTLKKAEVIVAAESEDRPVMRRGSKGTVAPPAPESTEAPKQTARSTSDAPRVGPLEPRVEEKPAEEPPAPALPLIEKARAATAEFTSSLPNYIVQQLVTRYSSGMRADDWVARDRVELDLIYDGGQEQYRNIKVGGKATNADPRETGTWSTGEFASVLIEVLHPGTRADFREKRRSTIAGREAVIFDYTVEQERSGWTIDMVAQVYRPRYTGSLWVDKETGRVLRLEMQARRTPREFPIDVAELAVDYDDVKIGNGRYLLPVKAENLLCHRGTSECGRNVVEFRNYKKYGAESQVTFDK